MTKLKKGDVFLLTHNYDYYSDANQNNNDDGIISEEDYNTYLFNKLVKVVQDDLDLTPGEKWYELEAYSSDVIPFGYLPEYSCKFESITNESLITQISEVEKRVLYKNTITTDQKIQEIKSKREIYRDRRNNFYDQAILAAVVGSGAAYKNGTNNVADFIDDATGAALNEFDKFYGIE